MNNLDRSTLLKKLKQHKLVVLIIVAFFLFNLFWVLADKRLPIIGDDARFLQGAYDIYKPLSQGDLQTTWTKWQNLFIHPERFPRTPLFALLAVPAFLLTGPNTDSAIVMNLLVVVLNSLLIYKLAFIFSANRKNALVAGLSAVFIYNTMPGVVGFGRLYMSETLQTFFVLLFSVWFFSRTEKQSLRFFVLLGVTASLAWLLRFIIPVYLLLPAGYFGLRQLQLRMPVVYYVKSVLVAFAAFLPLTLSWYGLHFFEYYQFARFTSSGELTKYYSLGPVSSPVTAFRFWYVILTWVTGWPFAVAFFTGISLWLVKFRIQFKILLRKYRKNLLRVINNKWFWLVLSPVPALAATTLTEGKTARYFLPAVPFLILVVAVAASRLDREKISIKAAAVFCGGLLVYPYIWTLIPALPQLPYTGFNIGASAVDSSEKTSEPYAFFFEVLNDDLGNNTSLSIYNTAEQTEFNDAELIWYGTEHGIVLENTDEFSRYSEFETGKDELTEADVVIIHSAPEAMDLWVDKYHQLRDYALNHKGFIMVASRQFGDREMVILVKENVWNSLQQ